MMLRITAGLTFLLLVLSACGGVHPPGPEAGGAGRYLAVIDARGDQGGGQVHIIDTGARKLVASLDREAPDGIFAPDGETLLLGTAGGLEWLRPPGWSAIRREKTAFHGWWKFLPEMSQYALNPDGLRLHAIVYHPDMREGGSGRLGVQTVELSSGKVHPEVIEVAPCAGRLLVPSPNRAYHICLAGPLEVLDLEAGEVARSIAVGPVTYRDGVGFGAGGGRYSGFAGEFLLSGSGEEVLIVTARGAVVKVDVQEEKVQEMGNLRLPEQTVIPHRQAVMSPDRKWLFVGTGVGRPCVPSCSADDLVKGAEADTVRVFSTADWKEARRFSARHPFIGMALVADGKEMVTVSASDRTVTFLETESGTELAVIERVGREPSLVLGGRQAALDRGE